MHATAVSSWARCLGAADAPALVLRAMESVGKLSGGRHIQHSFAVRGYRGSWAILSDKVND